MREEVFNCHENNVTKLLMVPKIGFIFIIYLFRFWAEI